MRQPCEVKFEFATELSMATELNSASTILEHAFEQIVSLSSIAQSDNRPTARIKP
jgi:hypothetical protein